MAVDDELESEPVVLLPAAWTAAVSARQSAEVNTDRGRGDGYASTVDERIRAVASTASSANIRQTRVARGCRA